jgi:hypothetical protein
MGSTFSANFKKDHPEELGPNGVVRVCIGGGAGFIGSHIAKRLKEEVILIFINKLFFVTVQNHVNST